MSERLTPYLRPIALVGAAALLVALGGLLVIGASALMTTTMPAQKELVDILVAKGLRDKYHVILGGAPVTSEWVTEAGADSWGQDAGTAVKVLEKAMAGKAASAGS